MSAAIEVRVGEVGKRAYLRIEEPDADGYVSATLDIGARYPNGEMLAHFVPNATKVRVDVWRDSHGRVRLWLDSASIPLTWANALKIADFLHLEIPQPELPAGQEVPR